jgi:predicted nucleotidyltransferase
MATARELGPAGWQSYLGPTRQAPRGRVAADAAETRRLLERVRRAARRLKELGARRVVLFGSLAHGNWWAPASDVDLAVQGLPPERFWDGWRVAEETIGNRQVDFVALEVAREPLRRAIERDGVEL